MKNIFDLLRYPIVKICGVMLILYFALLHNKENPESLGNRMSKENIESNLEEVKDKGFFIVNNLRAAQNATPADKILLEKAEITTDFMQAVENLKTIDNQLGQGQELKCADEAQISYTIGIKETGTELENIANENIIIGNYTNYLLEQKIIGMKKGGERIIEIPRNFKAINQKLALLLKFNSQDLFYKVNLIDFKKFEGAKIECKN